MDTNRIKRFATEARNKLKEGIAAKIRTLGFDKQGNVADEHRPQLMQGGTHWNGQLLPETFYHQWTSLFNRLCAIRILQKNDLCAPILDYTITNTSGADTRSLPRKRYPMPFTAY